MKDFSSFGSGLNFRSLHGECGPLRQIHPGVKLSVLTIGITVISLASSITSLTLLMLFLLTAGAAARIRTGSLLKPLIPVFPFLLIVLLIHALTLPRPADEPILYYSDIPAVILLSLRILCFMTLLGITTASMNTAEISYGLESLLSPLEKAGIKTGPFALIAMLTFRFIPILREESLRLIKAQTARGGSLGFRSSNPFKRISASIPLMVPLFLSTLHRAEILAESIQLRGFREDRTRTRLKSHTFSRIDRIWLTVSLSVFTLAIVLHYSGTDARLFETIQIHIFSRRNI